MAYRCFNVEIADGIAHIQLKRGDEINTMVPEFWRELPEIVKDIDAGAKARVIVISSTGKHFSGGMDLSVFTSGNSAGTAAAADRRGLRRRWHVATRRGEAPDDTCPAAGHTAPGTRVSAMTGRLPALHPRQSSVHLP